jgi:hypothetical protein
LPEDFDVDGPYTKGTFDVDNAIPQIEDTRIGAFSFVNEYISDNVIAIEVPAKYITKSRDY